MNTRLNIILLLSIGLMTSILGVRGFFSENCTLDTIASIGVFVILVYCAPVTFRRLYIIFHKRYEKEN